MFNKTPEFISKVNEARSSIANSGLEIYTANYVPTGDIGRFARNAEGIVRRVLALKWNFAETSLDTLSRNAQTKEDIWRNYGFHTQYLLVSSGIDRNSNTLVRCTVQKPDEEAQFILSWQPENQDDVALLRVFPFYRPSPKEPSLLVVKAFTGRDITTGGQDESSGHNVEMLHKVLKEQDRFQELQIVEELIAFMRAKTKLNSEDSRTEATPTTA